MDVLVKRDSVGVRGAEAFRRSGTQISIGAAEVGIVWKHGLLNGRGGAQTSISTAEVAIVWWKHGHRHRRGRKQ